MICCYQEGQHLYLKPWEFNCVRVFNRIAEIVKERGGFDSISIIGAQLANAIDDAMDIIDQDEYDDFLEWCDAVFDMAAERMNGSWKYLEITKYIEF